MLLRLPPPQLPLRGKCIEPPSPPIAIVFQAFLVAFVVVTREFRTIVRTARCLVVLFFETRRIAAARVISSAQHQDAAAISSRAHGAFVVAAPPPSRCLTKPFPAAQCRSHCSE